MRLRPRGRKPRLQGSNDQETDAARQETEAAQQRGRTSTVRLVNAERVAEEGLEMTASLQAALQHLEKDLAESEAECAKLEFAKAALQQSAVASECWTPRQGRTRS